MKSIEEMAREAGIDVAAFAGPAATTSTWAAVTRDQMKRFATLIRAEARAGAMEEAAVIAEHHVSFGLMKHIPAAIRSAKDALPPDSSTMPDPCK